MLRRVDNASVFGSNKITGVFRKKKIFCYYFQVGKDYHDLGWDKATYDSALAQQQYEPWPLFIPLDGRQYWWYRDKIYWENDDLFPEQVHVLLLDRERQLARKIERATIRSAIPLGAQVVNARQPIPEDVKMFVWQRDNGRCVKCGSNQLLEFDHIIPVVMGGSNTARNIQLLCEIHNREKGGHLA